MIKKLWQHSIRAYLKLGMFFYFKKIEVHGLENSPKNKPVLLLCNHQNALLDPLIIAIKLKHFPYYLTRAGVFQKEFVSKLLSTFNMLPVYRIRDGWNNLTNNNAIFERCKILLHQNETVVIFPEGSHDLARRVRPLSKGFTRIVFDTMETYPETDLQLLPIGLNFIQAEKFPDSASMFIGKPLEAKHYVSDNINGSVVKLKEDVHTALTKLTTHIPEENYDKTLNILNTIKANYLNPKAVNKCIANKFENCEVSNTNNASILKRFFKTLLIIALIIPYLIWKFFIQPKIIEIEFVSTFRFAIALTLVPLFILIVMLILNSLFGLKIAITYVLSVLFIGICTVKL